MPDTTTLQSPASTGGPQPVPGVDKSPGHEENEEASAPVPGNAIRFANHHGRNGTSAP